MSIEIRITTDTAEEARQEMRKLLGNETVVHCSADSPAAIGSSEGLGVQGPPDQLVVQGPAGAFADSSSATPHAPKEGAGAADQKAPLPPTRKTVEFAEEHGVDLATADIEGTGKNGRITKRDVEQYLLSNAAGQSISEATTGEAEDDGDASTEQLSAPAEPEPPEDPDAEPTLEDARNALLKLNEVAGLEVAREAVAEFGVKRVQELDPKHYRAFINDCLQLIREVEHGDEDN